MPLETTTALVCYCRHMWPASGLLGALCLETGAVWFEIPAVLAVHVTKVYVTTCKLWKVACTTCACMQHQLLAPAGSAVFLPTTCTVALLPRPHQYQCAQ